MIVALTQDSAHADLVVFGEKQTNFETPPISDAPCILSIKPRTTSEFQNIFAASLVLFHNNIMMHQKLLTKALVAA